MIKWLKSKWEKWRQYRWYFGIGWVKSTSHGILPSKYQTPEEIEAFKRKVEEVTKEVENQSGDSSPGIRL
jgi:hypothetical protein